MRRDMRRIVLWVVGISLAGLALYFGYGRFRGEAAGAELPPERVPVRLSTFETTVDATGSLAPASSVELSFTSAGRVSEVLVGLGDTVGAGELLAQIDPVDLEVTLASAEASLASARSTLRIAQADLVDLVDGPSADELELAQIELNRAKDSLWGTQSSRDATCGRVGHGTTQQSACNQAEVSVRQGEANVRIAEREMEALLAGADDEDLQIAREAATQSEAQLGIAVSQAEQARRKLDQATLTAPFTGTVTSIVAQPGAPIGANAVALTFADLTRLQVEVLLDETSISEIEAGQAAHLDVDAFPDAMIDGRVLTVAPTAEIESGVVLFPVMVELDQSDVPVRAGMTANVSIVTAREEAAITIPLRAVRGGAGRSTVEIISREALTEGDGAAVAFSGFGEGGGGFGEGAGGRGFGGFGDRERGAGGFGEGAAPGEGRRGRRGGGPGAFGTPGEGEGQRFGGPPGGGRADESGQEGEAEAVDSSNADAVDEDGAQAEGSTTEDGDAASDEVAIADDESPEGGSVESNAEAREAFRERFEAAATARASGGFGGDRDGSGGPRGPGRQRGRGAETISLADLDFDTLPTRVVEITLGRSNGTDVLVLDGLQPGDILVIPRIVRAVGGQQQGGRGAGGFGGGGAGLSRSIRGFGR